VSRPLRILVTGSRNWTDLHTVEVALRKAYLQLGRGALPDQVVVVHGGAAGADSCAAVLAPRMGFQMEEHRADWSKHGRAAGPICNQQMVDAGATVCLAFPLGKSIGTRGCMRMAAQAGIPVVNYGDEED
jgi:hypothetical protein